MARILVFTIVLCAVAARTAMGFDLNVHGGDSPHLPHEDNDSHDDEHNPEFHRRLIPGIGRSGHHVFESHRHDNESSSQSLKFDIGLDDDFGAGIKVNLVRGNEIFVLVARLTIGCPTLLVLSDIDPTVGFVEGNSTIVRRFNYLLKSQWNPVQCTEVTLPAAGGASTTAGASTTPAATTTTGILVPSSTTSTTPAPTTTANINATTATGTTLASNDTATTGETTTGETTGETTTESSTTTESNGGSDRVNGRSCSLSTTDGQITITALLAEDIYLFGLKRRIFKPDAVKITVQFNPTPALNASEYLALGCYAVTTHSDHARNDKDKSREGSQELRFASNIMFFNWENEAVDQDGAPMDVLASPLAINGTRLDDEDTGSELKTIFRMMFTFSEPGASSILWDPSVGADMSDASSNNAAASTVVSMLITAILALAAMLL